MCGARGKSISSPPRDVPRLQSCHDQTPLAGEGAEGLPMRWMAHKLRLQLFSSSSRVLHLFGGRPSWVQGNPVSGGKL